MTKRDFELIAEVIRSTDDAMFAGRVTSDTARARLALQFAQSLAATNPRFDKARFLKACEER